MLDGLALGGVEDSEKVVLSHGIDPGAAEDSQVYMNLRNFDTMVKAGFELRSILQGDLASDFKPMSIVGKGAEEIRVDISS
jgi:hypothetical protein